MAKAHVTFSALTPQEIERFWSKVHRPTDADSCWIWHGTTDQQGYGLFTVCRRMLKAHRVSYFLATGTDPAAMLVCHTCDNPPCVNPSHLFLGTAGDNLSDCISKGRFVNGRPRAHPETIVRGERCHLAKLTEQKVRELRSLDPRPYGRDEEITVARKYGISRNSLRNVIFRRTWKHI
jgi:hypothetical protein